MNSSIFYSVFLILGVFYLTLGIIAARKIKTQSDYFLAGRKLGFWTVMMMLLATQIGGGMVLGTTDEAYDVGIYGIAYTVGMFLGFTIMALGLASRLRELNVSTTAEIFLLKYHSPLLRKIAALLMIIALAGLLVGQVVATRRFMLGLGVYDETLFIVFWLFVITYTMLGGLKALSWIDSIQVSIVIVVFVGIFIWLLGSYPLEAIEWQPGEQALQAANINWIAILIAPVLFNIIEQDLAQRYCGAASKWVAASAAAGAAIIIILFAIVPTYFGTLGHQLGIEVPQGAAALMVILQALTNDWMLIAIAVALLAAIISTADSLLCAVSSNLSQDFSLWREDSRYAVLASRLVTLVCGIVVLFIAFHFDNIISVIVYSYLIPVSALTVPIFFALLFKTVYKPAAVMAVLAGLVGLVDFFVVGKIVLYPSVNELMPVTLSLIAYFLGWFWARSRA